MAVSSIEAQLILGEHTCIGCHETVETVKDALTGKLVELNHKPPCFPYMTASARTRTIEHRDGSSTPNPEYQI